LNKSPIRAASAMARRIKSPQSQLTVAASGAAREKLPKSRARLIRFVPNTESG